jgi:hypothetical protein
MKTQSKIKKRISEKFFLPAILFSVAIVWTSCEKDYHYVAPPVVITVPTTPISFATDVEPIFAANFCDGCHDGSLPPDLRAGFSYASIMSTSGNINISDPTQSELYKRIILTPADAGFMPDGGSPLTSAEIGSILGWIQQGAKNN